MVTLKQLPTEDFLVKRNDQEKLRKKFMSKDNDSQANEIMKYSFLVAFANDGTLDDGEIRFMKGLALKDGVIDEAEKSVFRKIFWRLTEDKVSAEAWIELTKFREEYDI